MAIGENIKRIRKQKGLTQNELGSLIGIPGSTVRKYELGIINPRAERLEALALSLGVNVEVLKKEELDIITAMHRLFQLFLKFDGAFDQSENIYFQKLDMQAFYKRWVEYQEELKRAEKISDESERKATIIKIEETFSRWMDTYGCV